MEKTEVKHKNLHSFFQGLSLSNKYRSASIYAVCLLHHTMEERRIQPLGIIRLPWIKYESSGKPQLE